MRAGASRRWAMLAPMVVGTALLLAVLAETVDAAIKPNFVILFADVSRSSALEHPSA